MPWPCPGAATRSRPCSAGVVVGEDERARDGRLSNGTPDWRPATRSDGSGVGAANRVKFRCQPTIVGRLSMTAAQAVEQRRQRREAMSDCGATLIALRETVAPSDHVRARHGAEFLRPQNASEAHE